jgi:hypothetical protein
MRHRKPPFDSPVLNWTTFLLVLTMVMLWAVSGVLQRARRMQTASTSAAMFAGRAPGRPAKAVIRLDQVVGDHLKGTLLEQESDTAYRVPIGIAPTVAAILTPETAVVMGRPQDIAVGSVVQLAGTLDQNRILRAKQVVILTGYVHLSESNR